MVSLLDEFKRFIASQPVGSVLHAYAVTEKYLFSILFTLLDYYFTAVFSVKDEKCIDTVVDRFCTNLLLFFSYYFLLCDQPLHLLLANRHLFYIFLRSLNVFTRKEHKTFAHDMRNHYLLMEKFYLGKYNRLYREPRPKRCRQVLFDDLD